MTDQNSKLTHLKIIAKRYRNFNFCILHFDLKQCKSSGGFTLLEMLVSIGIFAVVIVSSISVILSIGGAQQKVSNTQNIQDNIRFTLELMTKEMRQGTDYTGQNCTGSQCAGILFRNFQGNVTGYCSENGVIKRTEGSPDCAAGSPMTSNDIQITKLLFYLLGTGCGPADGQPRVTIAISGRSTGPKASLESSFNLQTTVTQRIRDVGSCQGV
ncbi:MAG: prepilin-type N-terminal cleavage/methylation domain-containing protein [Candidatus Sungbacteria bacterium]|nr:prepilin-type N-terminal cleavage/methylation domain-containing protein [Candidatus Sungbacteria bacterium]